jgi:uncharacterized protein (UPF0332 family)
MNAQDWLDKAQRAAASAKLLLEAGDYEGACNRAYYAMFDAAKAALATIGAPKEAQTARTHSGLISAFSLHLVKSGHLSVEIGRALNQMQDIRLVSDYTGGPIEQEQAVWALEQTEHMLDAVKTIVEAS